MPGGPTDCQVAPRSVVRRTVPRLPLAQATFSLTAESPRRLAVEPVGVTCHAKSSFLPDANASDVATSMETATSSEIRFSTGGNLTGSN